MVQNSAIMLYFYGFQSFAELAYIFVCIHVFVNVLSLVPHKFVAGHAVCSGIWNSSI